MKKALRILVTALALLAIMVIPVIAGGPKAEKGDRGRSGKAAKPHVGDVDLEPTDDGDGGPPDGKGWKRDGAGKGGKTGPAGKSSNVGHLYLHEKNTSGDWSIVEGGAWGKMKYNLSGSEFDFVFNGHGLDAGVKYTLIYYPDPWPGEGLICLGDATANDGGNVHIQGPVDTGDLPKEYDNNHSRNDPNCGDPDTPGEPPTPFPCGGAKIWLVLFDDVDCTDQTMPGWNPAEYLFEDGLINYVDTDV